MISVLMPVHNYPQYLADSVRSILSQTYTDFEFIIIDDGSRDEVRHVLNQFSDSRLIVLRNPSNLGLTRSLNIAMSIAKGDIFARHDGDDVALPNRFERELPFLKDKIGMVSCWASAIDGYGRDKPDRWVDICARSPKEEVLRRLQQGENWIIHPGTMFTREVYQKIGCFDVKVRYAQDYNYWLRLVKFFDFHIVPEILLKKRLHGGSVWMQRHEVNWVKIAKQRACQVQVIPPITLL